MSKSPIYFDQAQQELQCGMGALERYLDPPPVDLPKEIDELVIETLDAVKGFTDIRDFADEILPSFPNELLGRIQKKINDQFDETKRQANPYGKELNGDDLAKYYRHVAKICNEPIARILRAMKELLLGLKSAFNFVRLLKHGDKWQHHWSDVRKHVRHVRFELGMLEDPLCQYPIHLSLPYHF